MLQMIRKLSSKAEKLGVLSTHCLCDGRYSKNTVVSRIRFPPPPKPNSAMKTPKDAQFGAAPAIVVKIEQMNSDTLKANRLPIISALNPPGQGADEHAHIDGNCESTWICWLKLITGLGLI